MSHHRVEVPAIVAAKAAAVPGGQTWATDLPGILTALERAWSIHITEPLPGGTASYVTRARTTDGRPVVLKVAAPGTGFDQQARTLTAAAGRGYVRILAYHASHKAALLEALGTSLHHTGLAPTDQLTILGRCLRCAWRVPPAPGQEPQDKAASLSQLITDLWQRLDQPCSQQVLDYALTCAARRSAAFPTQVQAGTCVVVHGDATAANAAGVLTARTGTEDGFVLLDPDGFLGDPTYDLGVAVRDWCPQLMATTTPVKLLAGYCRLLAEQTATDPVAVWEWGYLERVSTGLYALSFGAEEQALPYLRTAQALLDDRGASRM
ncbi:aminoglycoside phosphotransferase family protein [Kineococcus sp. SYSU DK002]|uniref:aminoglycoside phosphotransferase family protein n=1 Tax=Kineococcus sp. SYSU DK002 TaxID=3383123 RepID=UPI003D7C6AC3